MTTFNQLSEYQNKDTVKNSKKGISINSSHMKWHLREEDQSPSNEIERHENLDQNDNQHIKKLMESTTKYSICICTDFVAPKFGGVETHGYQLAQCLIERGHKVIIISNMYNFCREGVRYMANGLKVYHLPMLPVLRNDVGFAALFNITSVLRQILIREHVDLCHGHLSTSVVMA